MHDLFTPVGVCEQVTATDWDSGENGRVYYSIPGSVASVFHVDQRGVISAHESIDRERYDAFRFPVLATDSAADKSRRQTDRQTDRQTLGRCYTPCRSSHADRRARLW